MTITERQLQTMLRLARAPDDDDPVQPLPWSVLAGLKELIPADSIAFVLFDASRRECYFDQEIGDSPRVPDADMSALQQAFWKHYWDSPACSYPDTSGDLTRVTTASDFYSDRELHSCAMYQEYLRFVDGEREMMLCLPSPAGRVLRLLFWRGPGPDFRQRDRDVLTLLRPHLYQAYVDQRQRRSGAARLTARQSQLLHLVAAGYSNGQIARRLGITEATVRKHLEHIFDRLHVTSRTAAVTAAFGDQYQL